MRDAGGRLGFLWMKSARLDSERWGGCRGGQMGVALVARR